MMSLDHQNSIKTQYGLICNFLQVTFCYNIYIAWWVVLTILNKHISQWEGLSHILWKMTNVPNHPPDIHSCERTRWYLLYLSIELSKRRDMFRPANFSGNDKNYFTSCHPHHDIYTFCYWQICWHSIWHFIWHSIWHTFGHSIWYIFWHSIWHIFWHSIWHIIWQIFWHPIWQTFWHFIWHTFWHSIWHIFGHFFWHSIWHIFWHSDISSDILAYLLTFCLAYLLTFFLTFFLAFYLAYLLTFYLTFFPLRSGSAHCDLEVAVEVRQCPLRSGSRGWGPAVPTAIWKSGLRSGSAHWDLELTVEVRQCPLRSATRGWGPAVPTGIWSSRWRSRCAHWDLDCEEAAAGEEAEEEKSSVKI